MPKTYLGDGVYADVEDYAIILTTETGLAVTNRIILEPPIYNQLVDCVDLWTRLAAERPEAEDPGDH